MATRLARSCQYQCVCKSLSKLFHNVLDIGPVSLSHSLDLGKAPTNGKWYLALPWARSCQCQCVCEISFSQNMPYGSGDMGNFHFFTIWISTQPRLMENCIWQSPGLDLSVSMCMQTFIKIFHTVQEIGPVSLFQNLDLDKCEISSKHSMRFKR